MDDHRFTLNRQLHHLPDDIVVLTMLFVFSNRSQAIQAAVREKPECIEQGQLARECAKLDPAFETAMAEERFAEDASVFH